MQIKSLTVGPCLCGYWVRPTEACPGQAGRGHVVRPCFSITPQLEHRCTKQHSLPYGQPLGARLNSRQMPGFLARLDGGCVPVASAFAACRLPTMGWLGLPNWGSMVDWRLAVALREGVAGSDTSNGSRPRLCWEGKRYITMGPRTPTSSPMPLPPSEIARHTRSMPNVGEPSGGDGGLYGDG